MVGPLQCFMLAQSTPILHHTETNCPHSFSITESGLLAQQITRLPMEHKIAGLNPV